MLKHYGCLASGSIDMSRFENDGVEKGGDITVEKRKVMNNIM